MAIGRRTPARAVPSSLSQDGYGRFKPVLMLTGRVSPRHRTIPELLDPGFWIVQILTVVRGHTLETFLPVEVSSQALIQVVPEVRSWKSRRNFSGGCLVPRLITQACRYSSEEARGTKSCSYHTQFGSPDSAAEGSPRDWFRNLNCLGRYDSFCPSRSGAGPWGTEFLRCESGVAAPNAAWGLQARARFPKRLAKQRLCTAPRTIRPPRQSRKANRVVMQTGVQAWSLGARRTRGPRRPRPAQTPPPSSATRPVRPSVSVGHLRYDVFLALLLTIVLNMC